MAGTVLGAGWTRMRKQEATAELVFLGGWELQGSYSTVTQPILLIHALCLAPVGSGVCDPRLFPENAVWSEKR